MYRRDMCKDDSEILTLSYENRCECKACPGEIHRAIMDFDGVKEMRSMDYKKGTAEVIVTSKVAQNPQKLRDWILKKAKKHAKIASYTSEPCHHLHEDLHNEMFSKETIRYREYKELEISRTSGWKW